MSWSIVRLEIYALLPVAVENLRLDTLAFCVIKFWEYPYVVDRSWALEIYPAVPRPIIVLVRFAVLINPTRFAVDTKFAKFAVDTNPAREGILER